MGKISVREKKKKKSKIGNYQKHGRVAGQLGTV